MSLRKFFLTIAPFIFAALPVVPAPAGVTQAAGDSVHLLQPCTEYRWQGFALVETIKGELIEVAGRGTVCANSRADALRLAGQAMEKHASQYGKVINTKVDFANLLQL